MSVRSDEQCEAPRCARRGGRYSVIGPGIHYGIRLCDDHSVQLQTMAEWAAETTRRHQKQQPGRFRLSEDYVLSLVERD